MKGKTRSNPQGYNQTNKASKKRRVNFDPSTAAGQAARSGKRSKMTIDLIHQKMEMRNKKK